MSWVPFLTVLLYHLSGKNSYPDHPQLPSSSTLAHELLRKAVNLPPESYHYWFTISDPTRFLTLSEIILASRVKPHFWTADTKLENFLHFPEMSSYHFVFNRRPFLLFHKENGNHKEEGPRPLACSPTNLAAPALSFSPFSREDSAAPQGPFAYFPSVCSGTLLYPRRSLCHLSLGPSSFSPTFTSSFSKPNETKSPQCPCRLHSSHALSALSQPGTSRWLSPSPQPLTSAPLLGALKPLTEVTSNLLSAKSRGDLSVCLIFNLLSPDDRYLRLQGLPSSRVAGLPPLLWLPFDFSISDSSSALLQTQVSKKHCPGPPPLLLHSPMTLFTFY